jgi:hypothetical protein
MKGTSGWSLVADEKLRSQRGSKPMWRTLEGGIGEKSSGQSYPAWRILERPLVVQS